MKVEIPEGAESHKEKELEDRYVTIVNEEGKTEEILESGVKVLVNPETGVYEYEFENGQWVEYKPRVMVVGEKIGEIVKEIEVPSEVIDSCAETVQNADLFHRIIDGKTVEVPTGSDSLWDESEYKGRTYFQWSGVLCGAIEYSSGHNNFLKNSVVAFVGVGMNSGDVLLISTVFSRSSNDFSNASYIFKSGTIPNDMRDIIKLEVLDKPMSATERANLVLNSNIGVPLYFVSVSDNNLSLWDEWSAEWNEVKDSLGSGEYTNKGGSSVWQASMVGASESFWKLDDN